MSHRSLRRVLFACFGASLWLAMLLATASPARATVALGGGAPTSAGSVSIEPQEWNRFAQRFVTADGRVLDIEKGRLSHSEGQSYGLFLALQAGDRPTFDRILAFTFRHMRGRRDTLVSWLYDPRAMEPIADRNNASDGDILIAYALMGAAARWNEPRYRALARPMIRDIGRHLLHRQDDMVLLRPGTFGFDADAHPDGPVVNLSYYVYGALLAFAAVERRYPFLEAWQSGLMLTEEALAHTGGHAPDWITLKEGRRARAAKGFAPKSSYDAVRIPLFMMIGGRVPARYLRPFDESFNIRGGGVPLEVNLSTGQRAHMNDGGYRAIAALTACAVRGVPIPQRLQHFRPTTYFSSALHLMALSAARTHYPHCMAPTPQRLEVAVEERRRTPPAPATAPARTQALTRPSTRPHLAGLHYMRASQTLQIPLPGR